MLTKFLRVRECKVSVGDFEIFPVHSFADNSAEPCADARLNVELIQTNDNINISYKAFRFRDGSSGMGMKMIPDQTYSES